MNNIDRLISEQVLSWARREAKARQNEEPVGEWPVITISREFGSGGRSLAKEIGKRIDFKVWDRELLTAITEEAGADERFLTSLDERRRKMIEDTLIGSFMGSKHTNTHYFRALNRVVQTIGAHGKSIIVGRGSNYLIKSPEILRLRLVCPLDKRVSFVAKVEGISEGAAMKMVKTREAEREDFIRHYYKRQSGRPEDFDLVLNSGVFNIEQLADITILAYEKKMGKPLPLVE